MKTWTGTVLTGSLRHGDPEPDKLAVLPLESQIY